MDPSHTLAQVSDEEETIPPPPPQKKPKIDESSSADEIVKREESRYDRYTVIKDGSVYVMTNNGNIISKDGYTYDSDEDLYPDPDSEEYKQYRQEVEKSEGYDIKTRMLFPGSIYPLDPIDPSEVEEFNTYCQHATDEYNRQNVHLT